MYKATYSFVIHSKDAFHHLQVQTVYLQMIKNTEVVILKSPKGFINSSEYKRSPFLCFLSAALRANPAPHGHLDKTPRPERQRQVCAACWVSGRTSSAPGYKWICYSSHFHTCASQIWILGFKKVLHSQQTWQIILVSEGFWCVLKVLFSSFIRDKETWNSAYEGKKNSYSQSPWSFQKCLLQVLTRLVR